MLQPKVYIKSLDKVLEVEFINFGEKTVEVYDDDYMDIEDPSIGFECYSFDEVEFMENTGLKDKNGKYIYVGDILKFDDQFDVCEYEGELSVCDGFNVAIVTKEKNFITLTNFQANEGGVEEMLSTRELIFDELNFEDFEVIGNIYENKELVK